MPVTAKSDQALFERRVAEVENRFHVRVGMAVLDTGTGRVLLHGSDRRFPFCSTFKVFLAGRVLNLAEDDPALLKRVLVWTKADEVSWSPVTGGRGVKGMRVAELLEASLQWSDNTATNLLLGLVGGPENLARSVRSWGDEDFRLSDTEPSLNEPRVLADGTVTNTSTAQGYLKALARVLAGDALKESSRAFLLETMRRCRTGTDRLPQAVNGLTFAGKGGDTPAGGLLVAHKTGSNGRFAHDVGLVESGGAAGSGESGKSVESKGGSSHAPVVLVIFTGRTGGPGTVANAGTVDKADAVDDAALFRSLVGAVPFFTTDGAR